MSIINIEGIRLFAYHGHLPEEEVLGGHFIVNVWIETDTTQVEKTDQLSDTVDYVVVLEIVKQQMAIRSKMIEHVAGRIANAILSRYKVERVKVEVEKMTPPVDACFNKISVIVEANKLHL